MKDGARTAVQWGIVGEQREVVTLVGLETRQDKTGPTSADLPELSKA